MLEVYSAFWNYIPIPQKSRNLGKAKPDGVPRNRVPSGCAALLTAPKSLPGSEGAFERILCGGRGGAAVFHIPSQRLDRVGVSAVHQDLQMQVSVLQHLTGDIRQMTDFLIDRDLICLLYTSDAADE